MKAEPAKVQPPAPPQSIAADKLSALTGYADHELRKLANKGYFPKAQAGLYELTPAITGCFKARKEQAQDGGNLPNYDSMKVCAARTGIPLAALKRAKKSGCEAFQWNRVALAPLLKWLFSQDSDSGVDWKDFHTKFQGLLAELAYNRKRGDTLDKSEVRQAITKAISSFFASLDRRSSIELPSALRGLAEPEIQKRLLASDDTLKEAVKAEMAALMQ